jgi:hypothetical protein
MNRQEVLTYIIIAFVLYICLRIYKESDVFNLKCIVSEIDGNKYCVRDRVVNTDAVDLLAKTVTKMKSFIMYLKRVQPEHDITKRLIKGFDPKRCMETLPTSEHKAYSENKGEKLAFCLNSSPENPLKLIDPNTLMFVALHELTHIGTKEIGHTPQYWKNFKFILENAVVQGIYDPIDYKKDPQNYCGMTITDNPYYDS